MTRARYADVVVDPSGVPVPGATVDVYDTGTTNHIAGTIYDAAVAGGSLPNPVVANEQGEIEFWLAAPAKVDLKYTRPGYVTETHTVDVLDALHAHTGTYASFLSLAMDPDLIIVGAITRDINGAATSAPLVWPDGSVGTYTADTVSVLFPGAVDAYHVTYGSPVTRTYTQPAVTRNASGAVTTRPALVVT